MYLVRIEHPVPDYEEWRRVFDSDPVDRKGSGVRRFAVFRSVEDPNYVFIDLELETLGEAEALVSRLNALWGRVEGTVMSDAHARIVSPVDEVTL